MKKRLACPLNLVFDTAGRHVELARLQTQMLKGTRSNTFSSIRDQLCTDLVV